VKEDVIKAELQRLSEAGKKIFITSSFQTHSIPLLHILAASGVPFHTFFLHTNFHFPETLQFRNQITKLLSLQLTSIRSPIPLSMQRDTTGRFLYSSDPEYCCEINKTQPLQPYLNHYDIWVSGVRRDQSSARAKMSRYQATGHRAQRFHPILDWTSRDIYEYRMRHQLPPHPLDDAGYVSIGCAPCTRHWDSVDDRGGRWFGMQKTECGLHTQLIKEETT